MRGALPRERILVLGTFAALVLLAALVALRAHYTADLSAFLPRAPSKAEQRLVDQLRDGLVSRLILLDVEGLDGATRAHLSSALATRLRADPSFRAVLNGESTTLERDRVFVFDHRYLLSDAVNPGRFTVEGLRVAIAASIELLASAAGLLSQDLFVHDPTGETLATLERLADGGSQPRTQAGVWVSAHGDRALLIAETRAQGSDTDGQASALDRIHRAFEAVAPHGARLRLTGPGVFAVEARDRIRSEVTRLSIASAFLIATLLLATYRSVAALLLGLLPVVSGALAGVAAVALGFGVVHGVTLGFGITLIGEAVDYSVYLFIQSSDPQGSDTGAWTRAFWPTIRLGMLTSICGFASLLPSGFPGLAQLGLYSVAGLIAAALVTRFVLPALLPHELTFADTRWIGRALAAALHPLRAKRAGRAALWLVAVAAVLTIYLRREHLWSHELSALSPVPAAEQALDGELRADLGVPDTRLMVVLTGRSPEAVLEANEALSGLLESWVAAGRIAGFQGPSRYLPSRAQQASRRASLPPRAELERRLTAATASLPVDPKRLVPFLDEVERARTGPLVSRSDLEGTSMSAAIDGLLAPQAGGWTALLPIQAPRNATRDAAIDAANLSREIAHTPLVGVEATVVDLKQESNLLYDRYLAEALRLSAFGFAAIILLLLVALRSVRRVARIIAPLVLAVLIVMSAFALARHPLTILHLIGLLLIVAVGSNYALFFDREASLSGADETRLLASLGVANLCTVVAFGVLSLSGVPVLSALGATVAPGTLLALVLAGALARRAPAHYWTAIPRAR
jgi:predicted exporter